MDEPTNHLDIASREILTDALIAYQGTLCFITHDRTLIHQVANKVIRVENGNPVVYPGDYLSYLSMINRTEPDHSPVDTSVRNSSSVTPNKDNSKYKQDRRTRKNSTNKLRKLNERIKIIESELEGINLHINKLETFFINPKDLDNPGQLAEFGKKHKTLQKQSKDLEQEWEQLSNELQINTESEIT
jgi:ATP-binding cassette subfamily F protein 3